MSCEGCSISPKGQNHSLDAIIQKAGKYAEENKETMAIYKEGHEYYFIEAGEAIKQGIPVLRFISKHN